MSQNSTKAAQKTHTFYFTKSSQNNTKAPRTTHIIMPAVAEVQAIESECSANENYATQAEIVVSNDANEVMGETQSKRQQHQDEFQIVQTKKSKFSFTKETTYFSYNS